jgi:quercetin dioxygenase-like cupin family protein
MLFGRPDTTLQVQEVSVEEGQDLGGFFEHDGEELVYLLEGTISVELQGRAKVEIVAGDAVWYRATTPHRWCLVGAAARILVISAATTRAVHG